MKITKNEKGISLISIMVAGSLLSIIIYSSLQLVQNLTKQINAGQKNSDMIGLMEELRDLLSDQEVCFNSFGGALANDTDTRSAIIVPNNSGSTTEKFKTNQTIPGTQLIISKYHLFDKLDDDSDLVDIKNGSTNLIVHIDRGDNHLSTRIIKKIIRLAIEIDPTNDQITGCFATGFGSDKIWKRKPNQTNPEMGFVKGMNIGIETDEPMAKLHVKGQFFTEAFTQPLGDNNINFQNSNVTIINHQTNDLFISNANNGGSYSIILTNPGATNIKRNIGGCDKTYWYPDPTNQVTSLGNRAIYTILTVYSGPSLHCYISWGKDFVEL